MRKSYERRTRRKQLTTYHIPRLSHLNNTVSNILAIAFKQYKQLKKEAALFALPS